jgi:type I restriction enzyme S subunit
MGYRAYSEYRDSGITGLDQVPSHWTTWKATHGFAKIGSGTTPKSDNANYYEGDIAWVTTSELRERPIFETRIKLTAQALQDYPTLKTYSAHSLIIAMYGATIGRLGILEIEATVNQACCVFSNPEQFDTHFFYYWLWMFRPTLLALSAGGGQPNLSQDTLKQIRAPAPSIIEQQKIANFLDHKTAQIDRLIEKKQELIEKLQEQIVTATTQAITKGLGNINLKPSGIAWLEQTPEHWTLLPLKFIATIGNGSTPARDNADYWSEDEIPLLNSSNVNKASVSSSDQFVTDMALRDCHLPLIEPPAILVGITGQGRTRGMATLLKIKATINQHLAYIKPDPKMLEVDFLLHVLASAYQYLRSESDGGGSTKGAITCEQLANLKIPVPPIAEQKLIADLIAIELKRSNASIEKAEVAIARLQEYRTALITAAVTGQIDVRDWQAPEASEQSAQDKEVA